MCDDSSGTWPLRNHYEARGYSEVDENWGEVLGRRVTVGIDCLSAVVGSVRFRWFGHAERKGNE